MLKVTNIRDNRSTKKKLEPGLYNQLKTERERQFTGFPWEEGVFSPQSTLASSSSRARREKSKMYIV